MQNEESGGTFVRYRYFHFHRSRASSFRQFLSHLHLHQLHHLQLHDCKLIPQNKEDYKSPDIQRVQWQTLHYIIQVYLLNNAITSFTTCTHQKQTDTILTTLMTNMQGRILKEKLRDTNGTRQGRSCSIQMMIN